MGNAVPSGPGPDRWVQCTGPVGVTGPVTVAGNVTFVPNVDGFGLDVTVTVGVALLTDWLVDREAEL